MGDGCISVMDRLPDYNKIVCVRYRDKSKHKTLETVGYYSIYKHCWYRRGAAFRSEVIAWKPIE